MYTCGVSHHESSSVLIFLGVGSSSSNRVCVAFVSSSFPSLSFFVCGLSKLRLFRPPPRPHRPLCSPLKCFPAKKKAKQKFSRLTNLHTSSTTKLDLVPFFWRTLRCKGVNGILLAKTAHWSFPFAMSLSLLQSKPSSFHFGFLVLIWRFFTEAEYHYRYCV